MFVSTSTDPKKPESEWFIGAQAAMRCRVSSRTARASSALHAAGDSHYHWPWYGKMIGGYFERHPKGTPKGVLTVVDAKHPATAKLPKTLERNDEWYYYKDFDPTMRVLVTIDPTTIGDGEADVNPNPLVWCHDFGGGRVFYSGLGHTSESYSEPYMVDADRAAGSHTPSASSLASNENARGLDARGRFHFPTSSQESKF